MFDLTDKVALITGATGALGEAMARSLHRQGATVIISGTRAEKLANLEADLKERVISLPCALNDTNAVQNLIPQAEEKSGHVDILVNNAGITRDTLALRMKESDWDDVLNINLKAAFLLSQSAVKSMMKRRYGRIINISSIVAVGGNPGQVNYCAAKAGLIGMSKALALEVASRGITVNCVAPGFIASDMTHALNETQQAQILSRIPQGRIGAPEDIANAVVYLSSDEASYVTGQTLHVNGGMLLV